MTPLLTTAACAAGLAVGRVAWAVVRGRGLKTALREGVGDIIIINGLTLFWWSVAG